MRQRRILKFVFLVVLAISAFHLSGIEAAFCDDGTASADSHGCTICQPVGHAVTLDQSATIRLRDIINFTSVEYQTIKTQEPVFYFFRPPIVA